MQKEEEILEGYIKGGRHGEDNLLRATIGSLSAKRSGELADAIITLKDQIPVSTVDLKKGIEVQVDKLIQSNERLAGSNEKYAKATKWLSIALLITTLVVGLLQAMVIWKTGR